MMTTGLLTTFDLFPLQFQTVASPTATAAKPTAAKPTAVKPVVVEQEAATQTEDELLARAKLYDEEAIGEIYNRYSQKIYAFLHRRTGDPTLAEDLTASVFLKMLEAIRNQRMWHTSFSGWIYRIAHNLLVDHYRDCAKLTYVGIDDTPLPASRSCPIAAAERSLESERLRSALLRLTEDQAMVISLRFLEHYSISEVATILGKSEGAIKSLQHRALATLYQLLENEELL